MNKVINQELDIIFNDDKLHFQSFDFGVIDLNTSSDNYNILKIASRNLILMDTLDGYYEKEPYQVALTNVNINIDNLNDLHGRSLGLVPSTTPQGVLCTFLDFCGMEVVKISNNKISCSIDENNIFKIVWSGELNDSYGGGAFIYRLNAIHEKGLNTDYCKPENFFS